MLKTSSEQSTSAAETSGPSQSQTQKKTLLKNLSQATATCSTKTQYETAEKHSADGKWHLILDLAPLYLRELCCPLHSAMNSRSLCTSQQGLLLVPFARTSAQQSRAFSVVCPSIWNRLPSQLRTLSRALSPAFFLNLRLLFLAVLASGAPLSSSLEEVLYKCSV